MSATLACPKCSATDNDVLDSRPNDDRTRIKRRRKCRRCGHRYTTYEGVAEEIDMELVDISKLPPLVAHSLRTLIEALKA